MGGAKRKAGNEVRGQRAEGVGSFQFSVGTGRAKEAKGKAFLTTKYTKHTKIKNIGEGKHSTFNIQHSEGVFSFQFSVFSLRRDGLMGSGSFKF